MPKYKELLEERFKSFAITNDVTSGMSYILETVGKPQSPSSKLVKETYKTLQLAIRELGADATMHDIAMRTFGDSYKMLEGEEMSVKDRIVAAQNISDLMLGTYSPIAFTDGRLDQYAEAYVSHDRSLLGEYIPHGDIPRIDTKDLDVKSKIAEKNQKQADANNRTLEAKRKAEADREQEKQRQLEEQRKLEEERLRKLEEERLRKEEEERLRKLEEERLRKEEEERLRKLEEERLRKEEEERLRKLEEERRRKEEEERLRKLEEERLRREEEERLRKIEEEKQRQLEEQRRIEEEKQRKIEEQRLKEQYKQDEAKRIVQHDTKNRLKSEIESKLNERRAAEEKEILESQKSQNSIWKRFMTKETGTLKSGEEAQNLRYDDATREETKKAILGMLRETQAKAPESMIEAFIEVAVNVNYYHLCDKLSSSAWYKFDEAKTPEAKEMVVREYAIEAFEIAYYHLNLFTYHAETRDDIAKSDRWILAQNIADLMLNKYSPIASSSKYAKYGDGYFSKHPDPTVLASFFANQKELKDVVSTVSKETNTAAPNVDYELVGLVAEKNALDRELFEAGYKNKHHWATVGSDVEKAIESQIVDILKVNADISEHRLPDKAHSLLISSFSDAGNHCEEMDDIADDAERDNLMRNFARDLFESTYMHIRNDHVYYDENIVHRVIAAQKITNLILCTCTPVKFDAFKYGKYADSYVLNNEESLREALSNYGAECTESDEAFAEFMKELNKARGLTSEIDETTNEEPEETEEIEETEREAIPGLKDDVEGKVNAEKSARVIDEKSKNAPSLNNN